MVDREQTKQSGQKPSLFSRALKVLAYPAGGFTGWWVARNHIRHSTFNMLREEGELDEIYKPHVEKKKALRRKLEQATTQEEEKQIAEELKGLKKQYTLELRERFKALKLNTLKEQSAEIYKQQTHKALIEGFTAATIMMGGILILANSKTLSHAFSDTDKEKDDYYSGRGAA